MGSKGQHDEAGKEAPTWQDLKSFLEEAMNQVQGLATEGIRGQAPVSNQA